MTSPDRYPAILDGPRRGTAASRPGCGPRSPSRRSATRPPTTPGSPPSCPAAWPRPASTCPTSRACPARADPYPRTLTIAREGRDAALRREPAPAGGPLPAARDRRRRRPVRERRGAAPGQGAVATTTCSTRRRRRRSRGACAARPASSSSTRTRAAPRSGRRSLEAWEAALAGDPVSAFGGVVALTGPVDAALARGARLDLPRGRRGARIQAGGARGPGGEAEPAPPRRPAARRRRPAAARTPDPRARLRTAGGAVLVTAATTRADDPARWRVATRRAPTDAELRDLDLAWRLVRGVTCNAIVLVRDGRLIGLGSGQTSRVDAARQAVEKARAISGPDVDAAPPAPRTRSSRSPTPSRSASRRAYRVRPAGRLGERPGVIAAVDAAGAAMLVTGVRHFRH